jgi:hypothetical protein
MLPASFSGLQGTKQANVLKNQPNFITPYSQFGNRIPLVYRSAGTAPKLLSQADTDSRHRVVLPCNGITTHVIRRPGVPQEEGMQPAQGFARHQIKGIAYQKEKPTNLKMMPRAGFYNPGMNNVLGQPK